ncbi:hypothetical protein [Lysinibacillus sp. 54212]|uniref:hypothetical protein n=1 Tax=Lysinibacillus sp. 54212 TaxID=3119829 RepID=UPI002FC63FDF
MNIVWFSDIWVSGGTLHLLGQSKDGKTLEIGINDLVSYYAYYLKIGNLVIDDKTWTLETKTFVPSSY